MKNFYSWYKKHITAAIFTGLIHGYHYRSVSGKPFRTGSYCHKSYRKHLHECSEHDDLSTGLLFHYHGYLQHR